MAILETQSPRISFNEDDKRPYVEAYSKKPEYHVGDKVYLVTGGHNEGPYVIASVSSGKYILSLENGEAVRDGEEVDVGYLKPA